MTSGQKNRQYTAFISYSHSDEASASWLHRALETFSAPNGVAVPEGLPVRDRRLAPIFRDREELSSSHDLSESIRSAIEASHALIVICSPAAAASRWVNEEIKLFKRLHGEERILALIVDGEDGGPVPFFPEALLQRLGPDGEIIDDRGEPLAADIRPGKDGKRHAKLKLAAGLLDVGLDTLVQRDAARERRRLTAIAGAAVAVMLMTAGLAAFALVQRDEARAQRVVAEQQSETANAALDYLVSLFEIANPATENPQTITALTILERGREKIDAELGDQPIVRSKLLTAIGSAYQGFGDLRRAQPILQEAADGPFISFDDEFHTKIKFADILTRMRLLEEATDEVDRIENVLLTDHSTRDDFSYLSSLVAEKRALLAYFGNDPERALDQYRRANEGCDIENPEHAQRCARIASSLGTVLVQRKQFGEGLKALRRARNARASLFGDDHLQVAVTNHNIGYAHFEAGEYDEAIEITSNAIRVFERLLDENHPFIGDAELVLGRIYDDLKQPENAIPHLRKSQETYAAAFGAESRKAGYGLVFLAWSQARAGRAAAAKQTLNRAYSIYEKNFEPDSFDMIDIEIYGAWIASQAGEHAFAKASCDEGLNKMIELRSENDPYVSFLQRECDSVTDRYNRHVQP